MSTCNHELGYLQTERYDCMETEFITLDFSCLSTANKLKSPEGTLHNFCPLCGTKLAGLLEARVEELTQELHARKSKEQADKIKREAAFSAEVNSLAQKTQLHLLPSSGSFLILFYPLSEHDPRNILLTGPKDLILRNCVHVLKNQYSKKDSLRVKVIYQVPSEETLHAFLKAQDFQFSTLSLAKRTQGSTTLELSISLPEGMVYVTEIRTDSEGDVSKHYERFGVHKLGEYLKSEFILETLDLTQL